MTSERESVTPPRVIDDPRGVHRRAAGGIRTTPMQVIDNVVEIVDFIVDFMNDPMSRNRMTPCAVIDEAGEGVNGPR
jgi:hypothetical protein